MSAPLQEAVVVAVVLFNAYSLGANCVERFVNYQTWHLIPLEAFKVYHRAQQPLIQAFVVAPMALGMVFQVGMAFWLPRGVDRRVVWTMIAATLAGALSTAVLQLPIHFAFNRNGYSPKLMRKLLSTDWIRKTADLVRLAATVELLHQLLRAH